MSEVVTEIFIDAPGVTKVRSGKVREVFDLGDQYLIVATDRVSAFDCILPNGIPDKGKVLTQLSIFWFGRLGTIVPNHLVTADVGAYPAQLRPYAHLLAGRSMLVQKLDMIAFECVARGYLAGSAWSEYEASGTIADTRIRAGYRQSGALDEPLFTPATKSEDGHDINVSYAAVADAVGSSLAEKLRDTTLSLYQAAADHADQCGLIIADTKFEFGLDGDGNLVLADEALTPDSSRFWPKESATPGTMPPSFDKQPIRDYLDGLDWNKTPPAPSLPDDVVVQSGDRYREAYRRLTGRPLDA